MDIINFETVGIMLFFIGIYGLVSMRNIIKTIISLGIMQSGIILFFLNINYERGKKPPVFQEGIVMSTSNTVDPVPQALMITAIIIGIAVTAVSLTMFISLYHKYGTTNWLKVLKKMGSDS